MAFVPEIHQRQSLRLKGYDYSRNGAYFVTVCTQNRECLFGDIVGGEMQLNQAGEMVRSVWIGLSGRFTHVILDESIIMPNHMHGIVFLSDINNCRGESCIRPKIKGDHKDRPYGTLPDTLGRIIQAFKSLTTKKYILGFKEMGWPFFPGHLWQRNYHEHIIRNEPSLREIRKYIQNNPAQWETDPENIFRAK